MTGKIKKLTLTAIAAAIIKKKVQKKEIKDMNRKI